MNYGDCVKTLKTGETFGELSLLTDNIGGFRKATVIASENTHLVKIGRKIFRKFLCKKIYFLK